MCELMLNHDLWVDLQALCWFGVSSSLQFASCCTVASVARNVCNVLQQLALPLWKVPCCAISDRTWKVPKS